MIFTDTFKEVLKYEGVVSVVTWSDMYDGHVSNTWNSYLEMQESYRNNWFKRRNRLA